jgi:predicted O-methyltransferase YrrM
MDVQPTVLGSPRVDAEASRCGIRVRLTDGLTPAQGASLRHLRCTIRPSESAQLLPASLIWAHATRALREAVVTGRLVPRSAKPSRWPPALLVGLSLAALLAVARLSSVSREGALLGGLLLGLFALSEGQRMSAQRRSVASQARSEAEIARLDRLIVALGRELRLQREALEVVHGSVEQLLHNVDRAEIAPRAEFDNIFRQSEALLALHQILDPPTPLPPTRGWAMSPDLLLHVVNLIRSERPQRVIECGSGISTAVVALALKRFSGGKVIALEHAEWAGHRTERLLEDWGISEFGEVRCAPLVPQEISGESFHWYSPASLPDGPFDLVIVDGPPGSTGPHARYPAGELLRQLAAPGWAILDDTKRQDELAAAQRWVEEIPGLRSRTVPAEKGAVELFRDPE